jgi:hypothetical protein
MEPLPISQLEAAINRARTAQPASGAESALARDVALLAAVYGRLIYERAESVDLERLGADEQLALLRWLAA